MRAIFYKKENRQKMKLTRQIVLDLVRSAFLALAAVFLGAALATPAYAQEERGVQSGKTTTHNGLPACDCKLISTECGCNT